MTIDVKVPQLPESVTDATLVSWHKTPGQAVARDENLVDLETDKVVLEVPAPVNGIIKEIRIQNGATVTSGELLATLEPVDVVSAAAPAATPTASKPPEPTALAAIVPGAQNNAAKLSPAVRRLLDEHDVEPSHIQGTGKGGRILKTDVQDYVEQRIKPEADAVAEALPATPVSPAGVTGQRREHRVPMTRLRARIAERMVEAQQTAAMLTTFNEVDLTEVMALRKRYKAAFEEKHGVRLGFMSFFINASIEALRRFPAVNASIEGNDIVYHEYFDIGIAVASERGLIVPVIRDADRMSFADLENTIREYGRKAQDGSISMDELTGGTFTITNGGVFGSMLSTPILNPPQSGILGMHKIQERAMVADGAVCVRPVMYVALTYDHRIIDGSEAVQFLLTVKESLEDPGRLLLQV
ncbi:MAG: 2-oxoglutarate dehydrogenase complex dihydrolipoyllysine-residue succinyltransferase [Gammaproteobacteria bacterium]|nr:2-oxoglutarate dehydrogenase complex dihydrolipoyllysine-residue succinyltransferase [Gammaproteobacteria bacterium]